MQGRTYCCVSVSEAESTGLGLIVNPIEDAREAADGQEGDQIIAAPSIRHVWIDMTKPMPRPQVRIWNNKSSVKVLLIANL